MNTFFIGILIFLWSTREL